MTSRTRVIAIALVALLGTSGCTGDNTSRDPDATSAEPISSAPTTPGSTTPPPPTVPLSPAEENLESAKVSVVDFTAVTDELATDPSKSLNKLTTVSRDQTATVWRQLLSQARQRGLQQIGATEVADATAKYRGKNSYAVTACIDVSKVNVVDKDGKSVVDANRPDRVEYHYTVEKASDGRWYVIKDKATETC